MIDVTILPAWANSPGMQHAREMLALALEHEAQATAPAASNRHHAVLQFVAAAHEFSSTVLRSPHDFPAHVVDFATGLLSEAAAFVVADEATRWR